METALSTGLNVGCIGRTTTTTFAEGWETSVFKLSRKGKASVSPRHVTRGRARPFLALQITNEYTT